jgi:predicted Zn-dependent protease
VISLMWGLLLAFAVVLLLMVLKVSLWLGIPLGILAGFGLYFYLARRSKSQLEAIFERAAESLKKQQFDAAIAVMKEGYTLARQQFGVRGSIDGQIGVIQYIRRKNDEAEPLLKSASMAHYIAKVMLAILQWKRGEKALAKKTFDLALKAGRKESLLYGVYAYVLNEMSERNAAIEVLNRGLKACKGDERLLANRSLLQNNKAMKMKLFGEQWYQFMLERPIIRQEPPPYARVSKRALRG